jgi:hypothetical protein
MKNSHIKNHPRLALRWNHASLLVFLALMTIFLPARSFGQGVWTAQDIGYPPAAGSSVLSGGNVVVSGTGWLWGTSDACQFYYQSLNGDGQIIARIQSETNAGKAGLMIRQSLAANSQTVCILMSGNYGPAFEVRSVAGGGMTNPAWHSGTLPAWYKLVRSGSTIAAYTSPDTITWTLLSSTTITLSSQVFIGLVASENAGNNNLAVTTFSNVSVTENDLLPQGGTISFDNDAGNVVDIAGNLGNLNFNNSFKEPNSLNSGATWANLVGGLNLQGAVQVVNKTGYVFYDTSVTSGTGANPGTAGGDANMFQNGTFMLPFSLANYASTANSVGLFFRVDSVTVGSGNNGYVIIVNPVASGSNYVFKYSLYTTSGYAPSGTPLATYTSTTAISNPAAPFYTLGVTVSGSTFTAQIYDTTGTSVGGTATFTDTTNANAGMAGFLVSGTTSTTGATAYQLGITPTGTAYPSVVWYVQAGASNGNGTITKPYTTIYQGETAAAAIPGSIVQVGDGTYVASVQINANTIIRSQHILGAHLEILGNYGGFYSHTESNWTVDGFEISPQTAGATGGAVTGGGTHVILRNCYIHDCGRGGVGFSGDYRVVYNNIVARNAFTNGSSSSGLSFWGLAQLDNNPGYHSLICNNIFYGNNNTFTGATDGNGIIIDDNRNTQSGHGAGAIDDPNYTGAYTLIENNLVFNNGGRGIEIFLSNNVDIVNNTVFENETRLSGGEICANRTNNVTCVNNIACSNSAVNSGDTPFLAGGQTGTVAYGSNFAYYNNIAYDVYNPSKAPLQIVGVTGTQPTFTGNGNITGTNPGFLNAIGNADLQNITIAYNTDFEALLGLISTSPAINTATQSFKNWAGAITAVLTFDLNGDPRPSGGGYDIGAYQYTTTP